MASMDNAQSLYANFWATLISVLYSKKTLLVPSTFHERIGVIHWMLQNDVTGLISTLLNYSVNSASSAKFSVECSNKNVEALLNKWLATINIDIDGIPTGLNALATDYYRERWMNSSFCALRMQDFNKLIIGGNSITVPTTMAFVNGGSIFVKRGATGNYTIGSDEFYLDKGLKNKLSTNKNQAVVIQKPYNRWFDEYPTPYLIGNGVYKNYLVFDVLAHKSEETISKIVPYLFEIIKNTEKLMLEGKLNYTTKDNKEEMQLLKQQMNTFENEPGKTPAMVHQFDTKYSHLIPDIEPIVKTTLYDQSTKNILAGLGFIEVVPSGTRKETLLNPRPFLAEVNSGVDGFKQMLLEAITKVIAKNEANRKLFSDTNKIKVIATPLKINVDEILDSIRQAYDRGDISKKSFVETLGFDYIQEKGRRKREFDEGDEELMYPPIVQNQEASPDVRSSLVKPSTGRDLEKLGKKPGTPEAKRFKNASLDNKICGSCHEDMGYYKIGEKGSPICPKCNEPINKETSNTPNDFMFAPCKECQAVVNWNNVVEVEPGTKQCPLCGSKMLQADFNQWEELNMVPSSMSIDNEEPPVGQAVNRQIASTSPDLEIAPYDTNKALPKAVQKKAKHAQDIWRNAFNSAIHEKPGDEAYAFRVAWSAMNKYLSKKGK